MQQTAAQDHMRSHSTLSASTGIKYWPWRQIVAVPHSIRSGHMPAILLCHRLPRRLCWYMQLLPLDGVFYSFARNHKINPMTTKVLYLTVAETALTLHGYEERPRCTLRCELHTYRPTKGWFVDGLQHVHVPKIMHAA
jgi:hypothetical protein